MDKVSLCDLFFVEVPHHAVDPKSLKATSLFSGPFFQEKVDGLDGLRALEIPAVVQETGLEIVSDQTCINEGVFTSLVPDPKLKAVMLLTTGTLENMDGSEGPTPCRRIEKQNELGADNTED